MNKVYNEVSLNGYKKYIPKSSGVYVVIDSNLQPFFSEFDGYDLIVIEAKESKKTFDTVSMIVEKLLEMGADRDAFVLGVGGGITTDIAGFAASIYKRGVKFGFIPTTLLSQVDASIGGKNGVNFNSYKNIIGVINQPEFVYVCSEVLTTLHSREFKAGIAEALKSFILFDGNAYKVAVEYFTMLENYFLANGDYVSLESREFPQQDVLTKIIGLCAGYKSSVVERDEFERGERRLLNLGHTFAHAIEKLCGEAGYDIMHGEAVAVGLVIAAKVAVKVSGVDNGFVKVLEADINCVGLSTEIPNGYTIAQLFEVVAKDKKVAGSSIYFILPYAIENIEDRKIELKELEKLVYDMC